MHYHLWVLAHDYVNDHICYDKDRFQYPNRMAAARAARNRGITDYRVFQCNCSQ